MPASPRSMDELVESAFWNRMQLFSLVPTLNQEVKRTNQLLLDCVGHSTLVTTNVGIP